MASKPYPDLKRGTWLMKYKPDPTGPWVKVTLGKDPRLRSAKPPKTPPADLAARAAEFADLEYRARHGLVAATHKVTPLAQYATDYLTGYRHRRDASSVQLLERFLRYFLAWCAEHKVVSVQGLTKAHCRDYLESRLANVAPNSLKTERAYLMAIWSRAFEDELIAVNPWLRAKVAKGTKPVKTPRFWSSDEVARIVRECRREWHRDLVIVLANTGIRISATLAMKWEWIDWKGRLIAVPAEANKGGTAYATMVPDMVHDVLARRLADSKSPFVFARKDTGRPYSYEGAAEAIGGAIRRAKVPHGTPHDFRHTFGRSLHLGGVPQSVISAMLGHSSISITEVYTKMDQADAIEFMRRLSLGTEGPA